MRLNLETLSSYRLSLLLNAAAEGSALQREIQAELHNRATKVRDTLTPWLFSVESENDNQTEHD